MTKNNLRTRF